MTGRLVAALIQEANMRDAWRSQYVSSEWVGREHAACCHVSGGPRPGGEYYLCHCQCHTACPLRGEASRISPERCSCPGTLAKGERHADMEAAAERKLALLVSAIKVIRHERREQRSRLAAQRVVMARAIGKSREEVRDMLLAEFGRRDLKPPPQPRLDNLADTYRTTDPAERQRLIREGQEMFREVTSPLREHAKWLLNP